MPYITLRICVLLELFPKEAQFERGPGEGPTEEVREEEKIRKIASYVMVILCVFMFCRAEAATINVTNVTELQNALSTAQSNGEDDTIILAPGIYTLSSKLEYQPTVDLIGFNRVKVIWKKG